MTYFVITLMLSMIVSSLAGIVYYHWNLAEVRQREIWVCKYYNTAVLQLSAICVRLGMKELSGKLSLHVINICKKIVENRNLRKQKERSRERARLALSKIV